MSVTINSAPQVIDGGYSEAYYRVYSNSASTTDFQFIVRVSAYDTGNTTSSEVITQKLRPDSNGFAQYNVSTVLKDRFAPDVFRANTGLTVGYNSCVKYKFEYGEELWYSAVTFSAVSSNSGYAKLSYSPTNITFGTGDRIKVQTSNHLNNPDYIGLKTVLSATSGSVTIDEPYGSTDTGNINYHLRFENSNSTQYLLNYTRQFTEREDEIQTLYGIREVASSLGYGIADTTSTFLTNRNLSKYIKVQPNQNYQLSFLIAPDPISSFYLQISTYPGSVGFGDQYIIPLSGNSNYKRFDLHCGPNNLSFNYTGTFFGVNQIIASHIDRYTVQLLDLTTAAISEPVYFKIDRTCTPETNVRMLFRCKKGNWDISNFKFLNSQKIKNDKESYHKKKPYNYSQSFRGENIIYIKSDEEFTATIECDYYEALNLIELIDSPEVYIVDNSSNNLIPVTITTDDWEPPVNTENEFIYQISYRYASPRRLAI